MTKTSKGMTASSYESVGKTYDGVRILKPKTKPKHFTTAQVRAAIKDVVGAIHVERQPDGNFAVRREGSSKKDNRNTRTRQEA